MRLLDLLYKMDPDTTVWISPDPDDDTQCFYFGEVGSIPLSVARGHEVVTLYPELYTSRFCTGITIITQPTP